MDPPAAGQSPEGEGGGAELAVTKAKFEEAGVPVQSKRKNRFLLKLTPEDFARHKILIDEAIAAAVTEAGI